MINLANFETIVNYLKPFVAAAVILFITLYLTHYGSRLVRTALEQRHLNPEVSLLLSRITYWAILVIGITSALSQLGFDLTSFVASLGIVSIALAFAVQDIAQNFMAGILLLVQQPFKIGDIVEINGKIGRVTTIEIRSTTIRTFDGLFVIIPNAQAFGNPITNFSISPKRQITLEVEVNYVTNLQAMTQLILEATQSVASIQAEPTPMVRFYEFDQSLIRGELKFWISNTGQDDYLTAIDTVTKNIKTIFDRESIASPFHVRVIYTQSVH
jgi:small conductance mechanosensitive channel